MFEKLEKKYSWGVIGAALGIFFGLPGLYASFHVARPSVALEILADANVLDVRRPVQDLAITFQGEDIEKNDLALRVMTVRVVNDGEKEILQGQFDVNEEWGIRLSTGRIVSVKLVNASSPYLEKNLEPKILSPRFIRFNKVIFERNHSFALELLLLHPKRDGPSIAMSGKIAGIEWGSPVRVWEDRIASPFWTQVLSGGASVHLTRSLIYVFILILLGILLASIVTVIEGVKEKKAKASREEMLKQARIPKSSIAARLYVEFGIVEIKRVIRLAKDPDRLSRMNRMDYLMADHIIDGDGVMLMSSAVVINALRSEDALLEDKSGDIQIKPEVVRSLEDLVKKIESLEAPE